MKKFSHTDKGGKAVMVDIAEKEILHREARAEGFIRLGKETISLVEENLIKKGDVLSVARLAGINAAKQTGLLIPLCHNIVLEKIAVEPVLTDNGVKVSSEVICTGKTGVEMEALTSVAVALLTIYDMCKAVDKNMTIEEIKLIEKIKR